MKYEITRWHMLHEGGTKFYDFYRITMEEGTVTVGNYGPFPKSCPTPNSFGRIGGKTKYDKFTGGRHLRHATYFLDDLIYKKKKRGYKLLGESFGSTDSFHSFVTDDKEDLTTSVKTIFGCVPVPIREIMMEGLEGLRGEKIIIMDEVEKEDKPEPVRHAEWGSW